jgi:uncharacterized protein
MKNFYSITFFLVFVLCIGCKAQKNKVVIEKSKTANTLLWQVTGNGLKKPSYIFGTMHLLCAEDAVISKNLNKILNQVDVIYMELKMDNLADMMGAMQYMNMNGGVKLKDLLTEQEYQKVKQFFKEKNTMIPFSMMENFKPMLVSSTLMEGEMPCKGAISGIEMRIMEQNKKEYKKEILGLETMKMQLAIFDSIPYKDQAKMLLQYVDSLPNTIAETQKLVDVYKSQQLKDIETLMSKSEPGLEKYMNLLLVNRNKNWVQQMKTIFPKNSIIAAVGAGHLVGKEGVLELLKKAGYTVTPLVN